MKRDLTFERTYPHPPEAVWRAIANREALSRWLMPNDFEPRVGHRFNFRTKPGPGFDGVVHCEVLAVDEPRRLSYTWRGGPLDTVVTFLLQPAAGGATRLELTQMGFTGIKAVLVSTILKSGWNRMLDTILPAEIAKPGAAVNNLREECGPGTNLVAHVASKL